MTLTPVLFAPESWYEIDTLEDLAAAELIFPRYSEMLRLEEAAAPAAGAGVAG